MSHRNGKRRARAMAKRRSPITPLLVALGGLLLLGLTAFMAWRSSAQAPPAVTPEFNGTPRLKADRETVDLGNVSLGQTVEVAFELTNAGDQPLRFIEAPYVEVVEGC